MHGNDCIVGVNWKHYEEQKDFHKPPSYSKSFMRIMRMLKPFRHLEYLAEFRSVRINVLERAVADLQSENDRLERQLSEYDFPEGK